MATTEQTPVEGFAIGELTDDWARHLRAKNLSTETIKSYLLVARNFVGYLAEQGMPQAAVSITREHIEAFRTPAIMWQPRSACPSWPDRSPGWWGFIILIRAVTCGFLGGIMRWLGTLDGHGVVPSVRPDPQHPGRDAATRPR